MKLPFLRQRQEAAQISPVHMSDGSQGEQQEDQDSGLMEAARDLMKAHEMKDARRLADALRAAFQILESEPHEEALQINEEQE